MVNLVNIADVKLSPLNNRVPASIFRNHSISQIHLVSVVRLASLGVLIQVIIQEHLQLLGSEVCAFPPRSGKSTAGNVLVGHLEPLLLTLIVVGHRNSEC